MNIYKIVRPLIFKLDPENAHDLAIKFLKSNLIFPQIKEYRNLEQNLFGFNFRNPIGMAAGFDKNAEIAENLTKFGFGFVECGTVTPLAQKGNEKPRIFRLTEDKAIINRLGFNNHGANVFEHNFVKISNDSPHIIGINIGKNKDTKEAIDDYLELLERFYSQCSYITINISSPNTENLRNIQKEDQLNLFLITIKTKKIELEKHYKKNTPIFLKIAPDLTLEEQEKIAIAVLASGIDGIIISNTTIARDKNLKNSNASETGGLSGKPLFAASNEVLKNFYKLTEGKIPLIGVGGISSAEDAYEKIKCGASLVQIYSAFIYEGFGLVERIKKDLSKLVKEGGFKNISEAVGIACK
ncbi:MAG: quinone-dependent dihydroorotate dehydrogenase [Rickettsiales bacterium]|nr:quinone-dependent dihydroorotate dehydrogenase [Rickettsiales bacterium]